MCSGEIKAECSKLDFRIAVMPNDGVNYRNSILFRVQGTNKEPGVMTILPLNL